MTARDEDSLLERDLLVRVGAGDRAAFETFFRRYERRVFRYVARLVDDDEVAAEVASDVMVEVWHSATRYAGRSKPSTWVFGIAHHRSLDRLRRRRPRLVELHHAERQAFGEPDRDGDPERRAIAAGTRDAIDAAMATLSPEHRAVLHLTFVLDYAQAEIADIVGVPLGTVKTRVFHAKRALRAALTASGLQKEVS